MAPESRFEADPEELLEDLAGLPSEWVVDVPHPDDDLARLTTLLRDHERSGRGWAGADEEDVLVEVSAAGLATRQNVVVRDGDGLVRAWGSVHDRASGRMLLLHVVDRELPDPLRRACSSVLVEWAVGQAREVGAARGLPVQQIDTGAFAADDSQHRLLARDGFERVRTWWQMTRQVTPEESSAVPSPQEWSDRGVRFALAEDGDLADVHAVLEAAFTDHFNSKPETLEEFLHRMRETPGYRRDHWWLARLEDSGDPVGALVGTRSGERGLYVAYIGVVEAARGRGVAKGLLRTIIADAAARGRDRVGLEVDSDSSTGAHHLYESMGWRLSYETESWHRDVPVQGGTG